MKLVKGGKYLVLNLGKHLVDKDAYVFYYDDHIEFRAFLAHLKFLADNECPFEVVELGKTIWESGDL